MYNMQPAIIYLRSEIARSTSNYDRSILTTIMNYALVNATVDLECMVIGIQNGEYSPELKVVAGWVQPLMVEPNLLVQLTLSEVLP